MSELLEKSTELKILFFKTYSVDSTVESLNSQLDVAAVKFVKHATDQLRKSEYLTGTNDKNLSNAVSLLTFRSWKINQAFPHNAFVCAAELVHAETAVAVHVIVFDVVNASLAKVIKQVGNQIFQAKRFQPNVPIIVLGFRQPNTPVAVDKLTLQLVDVLAMTFDLEFISYGAPAQRGNLLILATEPKIFNMHVEFNNKEVCVCARISLLSGRPSLDSEAETALKILFDGNINKVVAGLPLPPDDISFKKLARVLPPTAIRTPPLVFRFADDETGAPAADRTGGQWVRRIQQTDLPPLPAHDEPVKVIRLGTALHFENYNEIATQLQSKSVDVAVLNMEYMDEAPPKHFNCVTACEFKPGGVKVSKNAVAIQSGALVDWQIIDEFPHSELVCGANIVDVSSGLMVHLITFEVGVSLEQTKTTVLYVAEHIVQIKRHFPAIPIVLYLFGRLAGDMENHELEDKLKYLLVSSFNLRYVQDKLFQTSGKRDGQCFLLTMYPHASVQVDDSQESSNIYFANIEIRRNRSCANLGPAEDQFFSKFKMNIERIFAKEAIDQSFNFKRLAQLTLHTQSHFGTQLIPSFTLRDKVFNCPIEDGFCEEAHDKCEEDEILSEPAKEKIISMLMDLEERMAELCDADEASSQSKSGDAEGIAVKAIFEDINESMIRLCGIMSSSKGLPGSKKSEKRSVEKKKNKKKDGKGKGKKNKGETKLAKPGKSAGPNDEPVHGPRKKTPSVGRDEFRDSRRRTQSPERGPVRGSSLKRTPSIDHDKFRDSRRRTPSIERDKYRDSRKRTPSIDRGPRRRTPSIDRYRGSRKRTPSIDRYRDSRRRTPSTDRYRGSRKRTPSIDRYRGSRKRTPSIDRDRYRDTRRRTPSHERDRYRDSYRKEPLGLDRDRQRKRSRSREPIYRRRTPSSERFRKVSSDRDKYREIDRMNYDRDNYRDTDRRSPSHERYKSVDNRDSYKDIDRVGSSSNFVPEKEKEQRSGDAERSSIELNDDFSFNIESYNIAKKNLMP